MFSQKADNVRKVGKGDLLVAGIESNLSDLRQNDGLHTVHEVVRYSILLSSTP